MTRLALFDMDGTLSDDSQRQHLYQEKRYTEYFSYEAQMSDKPYEAGRALYDEMLRSGWEVGYLTARLERNRQATTDWLNREGFEYPDRAILRPEVMSFMRPPRFKSYILQALAMSREYDEIVLVDNDPLVVDRITEDLGERFVFLAKWGANEPTASISIVHQTD